MNPCDESRNRVKREGGTALLVTAIMILMVSLLALTSLRHTEEESTASARSRAAQRTLAAADAGVEFALNRIQQFPPNLNAFSVALSDGVDVESRTREESTAQSLPQVGLGESPEGYSLNVGSDAGYISRVFRVDVTAFTGTATAEVQAKLSRLEAGAGGY